MTHDGQRWSNADQDRVELVAQRSLLDARSLYDGDVLAVYVGEAP